MLLRMAYGDIGVRSAPQDDLAIQAIDVHKRYKTKAALDGFNLTVAAGTVCGLLGPNGAGKTTAVRILTTLLRLDAGRAYVAGCDVRTDPRTVRYRIGLVGQNASVDEILSGRQNLVMFGKLYHLPAAAARQRADELLEQFDLTGAADRSVAEYSGGMRRRLDLATSLILTPPVLFLDEPTTGLDPRARIDVWTSIKSLVGSGTTVLLTTQYLEEADQLADQIALIDAGRVVAEGTPDELKAKVGPDRVETITRKPTLDEVFLHLTGHPATSTTGQTTKQAS
jgi:ABC-2 type transport system ATP-binding protein